MSKYRLYDELCLDATEVRVVWNATVMVYDPSAADEGCIDMWKRSFAINNEVIARDWIREKRAEAVAQYGGMLQP